MRRLLVLLAACAPSTSEVTQSIDMVSPWPMHVIANSWRGADGVDLADVNGDGRPDIATAWEESKLVTVCYRPATDVFLPWPCAVVSSGLLPGVEDAKIGDVDGDGLPDVVSASESGMRIAIHFQNPDGTWTTVILAASQNLQYWMQVALADLDGDGRMDIAAGGRRGAPGTYGAIGWFPGPADPRDPNAWAWREATRAGWIMSIIPRDFDGDGDVDMVVSDRQFWNYYPGTTTKDNTYTGKRWVENVNRGAAWQHRRISFTPGDEMFVTIADIDDDGKQEVIGGSMQSSLARLRIAKQDACGCVWKPWATTDIPTPTNVGQYQGEAVADVDGDGVKDLGVTFNSATDALSGVVWLRGPTFTERGEISGPDGTKFDNAVWSDTDGDGDPDLITTEQGAGDQSGGLGLIQYEDPR